MECNICGGKHLALGYCKKHYRAAKKWGDPNFRANLRGVPFEERYVIDLVTGCWNWIGAKDSCGYGTYSHTSGNKAHRYVWEKLHGAIPEGMCVLHKCDNPACVNPEHLFLGTHDENMKDMVAKGRSRGAKGEKNAGAILSADQVRDIYCSNKTNKELAVLFGVDRNTIMHIKNQKSWQDTTKGLVKGYPNKRVLTMSERGMIAIDTRPQKEIALSYGVSQTTVSVIQRAEGNRRGRWYEKPKPA